MTKPNWIDKAPQYVLSSPNISGGGVTTNFWKNGFQNNDLSREVLGYYIMEIPYKNNTLASFLLDFSPG